MDITLSARTGRVKQPCLSGYVFLHACQGLPVDLNRVLSSSRLFRSAACEVYGVWNAHQLPSSWRWFWVLRGHDFAGTPVANRFAEQILVLDSWWCLLDAVFQYVFPQACNPFSLDISATKTALDLEETPRRQAITLNSLISLLARRFLPSCYKRSNLCSENRRNCTLQNGTILCL